MPRAPDKRIEQAKELYLQGKKLIEIANQLNLPEGTVRRWKSTHKWDSERSDKNSERSEKKKVKKKKPVEREVNQVIENPELTDKQRLFCVLYADVLMPQRHIKKHMDVHTKQPWQMAARH